MSKRRVSQLPLFPLPLPGHIRIVSTSDLDITTEAGADECARRMFAVPLDCSILLDFLVGRKRGERHQTEEHAEFHRLQSLLNSQFRHERFNWLGDSLTAVMVRRSIATMADWMPGEPKRG
jgi:hypothetical protein